jgi:peptidoglycan/LPS O-acetylase OafA/YrhL
VWIRRREPTRFLTPATWIAAVFLILCLIFVQIEKPFLYYGGLDAIDIACAVLILALLDGRWGGRHLFGLRIFVVIGMVSYGFYLWHLPVFYGVHRYAGHYPDAVQVVLAFVIAGGLTAATWFCLERPALNWKNRLESRRVNSVSVPTPTNLAQLEAESSESAEST